MNDTTIIPDGRPMFAWKNEIDMLRKENIEAKKSLDYSISMMRLCGIVRAEWERDVITNDLLIRVSMSDMVKNRSFVWEPEKFAEVVRV